MSAYLIQGRNNICFNNNKSWISTPLGLKAKNLQLKYQVKVQCMTVQQVGKSKVSVTPLELENAKEPPLHLYKAKEPYTATIVKVERLVGPAAPGETCHIVIDHGGNVPYWEGQSYGIIPPVPSSNLKILLYLPETVVGVSCITLGMMLFRRHKLCLLS